MHACFLVSLVSTYGVRADSVTVELPRQKLSASLITISTLFNVQIFYRHNLVAGSVAEPVSGDYSFQQVLGSVLQQTSLGYRQVSATTYIIEPAVPVEEPPSAAAPASVVDPIPRADVAVAEASFISEIVVSARKRSEDMQDVPLAVSSVSEEQIENQFSRDIRSISILAPNVIIDSGNANTSSMSVRGISLSDLEKSFDPAIGIMVDGVYLGSTSASLLSTFDLEQVEILRGPQGTIQGKNTTGGLLTLQHSRPTGELGGIVAVAVGADDLVDYQGLLNMPIVSERLAAKLTYSKRTGGEYIYNSISGNKEGGLDFSSYGLSLLANPSPNFEIQYSYSRDEDHSDSVPFVNSSPDDSYQCVEFGECGADFAGSRVNDSPEQHPASFQVSLNILRLDYELHGHQLTAISGYRDLNEAITIDYDNAVSQILLTERPAQDRTFSQEVRVSSNWSDQFQYVAGAFYWDREYALYQTTKHLFEHPFYLGGGEQFFTMEQRTDSWSAFAQTDIQLADEYTLTLGGRYISEQKQAFGTLTFIDENGTSVEDINDREPVAGGGPVRTYRGSESWTKFTPNVALKYTPGDDLMFYAAYTEGFRSGGFNGRARSQSALGPYDPERVTNFELGMKSDWLQQSLLFNQTFFLSEYKDKQEIFSTFVDDISTALVTNAASATLWGVELELQYQHGPLRVSSSYGYLHSEYDEYEITRADGTVVDYSDFSLLLAPKHTFGLSLDYTRDSSLLDGLTTKYLLQLNYRDQYQTSGDQPEHGVVDGYTLVSAAVDLAFNSWNLSMYGKNLTDEYYRPYTNNVVDGVTGDSIFSLSSVNAPRSWGVKLAYIF